MFSVESMTWDPSQFIEESAPADERRLALGFLEEAFAEAILAGIDSDCVAQVALFSALQELIGTYGEEPVVEFAKRLPERIKQGEFTVARRH